MKKIFDTHFHLFDPSHFHYPWMDEYPEYKHHALLKDYQETYRNFPLHGAIYVNAEVDPIQAVEEAAFVTTQSKKDPRILGMVAFAPLSQGLASRATLLKLKRMSIVKGIREVMRFHPDSNIYDSKAMQLGTLIASEMGFSIDLCCREEQLPSARRLIEKNPMSLFILNHLGCPDVLTGEFESWKQEIKQIAAHKNVVCKISGLIEQVGKGVDIDTLRPYVLSVIRAFGKERILFGSNWSVLTLCSDLPTWLGFLNKITSSQSKEVIENIFFENAKRIYRI